MSDLTVYSNTDDVLAQLAAEFGLETEVQETSASRTYTNFSKLDNVRVLKSSWQGAKTLEWNFPGEDYLEKFGRDFPYVNEVEGFVIHAEIQPGLQVENKDENSTSKTKTLCSVVGYKKGSEFIKKLPERLPFTNMYGAWDSDAKRPVTTVPNKGLADLELLGSRGKSCRDCIFSGESTKDYQGNDVGECKLRGRIFFYVTHLISYFEEGKKVEREVKSIQELLGVPGVVLMISLPTAMGLKGKYDKNNEAKNRQCYLGYLTNLSYKYKSTPPESIVKLLLTNISIQPPVVGETQPKNYLTFKEVGVFDRNLVNAAKEAREANFPKTEPTVLDSSNWVINGKGGSTMYAKAEVDYTADFPAIEASMVEEDDDENIFG